VIELATCGADVTAVTLNGTPLELRATEAELEARPGWFVDREGLVHLRLGRMDVGDAKRVVVRIADGDPTGNDPRRSS
jgi:hypothetical protein